VFALRQLEGEQMELCKTVSQLAKGDKASLVHTVSDADLPLFAASTGDVNPIHFDQQYAEGTFFKGRIAHGMLCGGFVSAVIGNHLPGLGTVYVSHEFRFLAPVRIGDTITAQVEVVEIDAERNRVKLRTTCAKQDGTLVLDGEAVVAPPKKVPAPEAADAVWARGENLGKRLGEGVKGFIRGFSEQPAADTAAARRAAGDAADLWNQQLDTWLSAANAWQEKVETGFQFWLDNALELQKVGQRALSGWASPRGSCTKDTRSSAGN
jgi:3-hydroxybutyryl-CoA dehydratase